MKRLISLLVAIVASSSVVVAKDLETSEWAALTRPESSLLVRSLDGLDFDPDAGLKLQIRALVSRVQFLEKRIEQLETKGSAEGEGVINMPFQQNSTQ